jgi:hypothetical protein
LKVLIVAEPRYRRHLDRCTPAWPAVAAHAGWPSSSD